MFRELVVSNVAARKMMLAGCAALVVLSFGFNVKAEARMDDGDRMTATAQECGYYQDQFDKAKASGDQAGMSHYINLWYATVPGCWKYYGGITMLKSADSFLVGGNSATIGSLPGGGSPLQTAQTGVARAR